MRCGAKERGEGEALDVAGGRVHEMWGYREGNRGRDRALEKNWRFMYKASGGRGVTSVGDEEEERAN